MTASQSNHMTTAESRFRSAFERLKYNIPNLLPKGSIPSQNNVAKEAGCDASDLRKTRFPLLILEIQEWNDANKMNKFASNYQKKQKLRQKQRNYREQISDLKSQRDRVTSIMHDAALRLIELMEQLEEANAKIADIQPRVNINSYFKRND